MDYKGKWGQGGSRDDQQIEQSNEIRLLCLACANVKELEIARAGQRHYSSCGATMN